MPIVVSVPKHIKCLSGFDTKENLVFVDLDKKKITVNLIKGIID